jgi:multidrug resistance protein
MRKEKLIVLMSVLTDVIGFGIVIPIMPFYVTNFGASASTVTMLFTAFSVCSFFSAPLLGALSDRIGRRPVMIISITSTAIGWLVFASAHSLWQLFLGRIIDGLAAGNFTTAQSYMVDLSKNEQERIKNLGIIGAAFGIGFILGPVIGGVLSRFSPVMPFWGAGILASVNAVSAYFFLPESHHTRDTSRALSLNPLRPLVFAARDRSLRPLYFVWSFFAFAIVTGQSVFGLFVKDVFGMSAFQTGMLFTVIGVLVVVNQGYVLPKFWKKRFSSATLEWMMLAALGIGSLLVASRLFFWFMISLIFSGTGQAVLRVVVTEQAAAASHPMRKGETLGVFAALMSAYMALAPYASGVMYEVDHRLPYLVSTFLLAIGIIFSLQFNKAKSAMAESQPVSLVEEE